MAGPLTERPGPDATDEERWRWWVDVAFTEGLQRAHVTWGLLGALLAAHLTVGFSKRGWGVLEALAWPRPARLLRRFGALDAGAVTDGEWWRLVSYQLLHGDGLHLLLNGAALLGLGRLCEAIYGPARFLWIFLLCGIGGGMLSLTADKSSVGASGAIFGLMGAAMAFGWRRGAVLPDDLRALLRRSLLPWVALNLLIGLVIPFVDNRAHVGGLVTGILLGVGVGDRVVPGAEAPRWRRAAMGAASAGLLAWALWGASGSAWGR